MWVPSSIPARSDDIRACPLASLSISRALGDTPALFFTSAHGLHVLIQLDSNNPLTFVRSRLSLSVRPFLRLSLYCSFISAEIRCWSQDSHKATALTTDFFFWRGSKH
jgi:hypothetical protein